MSADQVWDSRNMFGNVSLAGGLPFLGEMSEVLQGGTNYLQPLRHHPFLHSHLKLLNLTQIVNTIVKKKKS